MAPPRLQCLSAVKQVAKKGPNLRAAFSTSQTRTADDIPPRRSGVSNDLLSSLDNKFSSNSTNMNASFSRTRDSNFMNTNPIGLPREKSPKIRNSTHNVYKLVAESAARRKQVAAAAQQTVPGSKSLGDAFLAQDYSKQITRRWRAGDIYAPHDLSGAEMKKWKRRSQPTHDVFDVLNFNPEQHYRNFSIMSEYMTTMGRIKHSRETGLRPVNQRRIARAIRRSIGLGLMPSVHRHPEILYKETQRSEQTTPSRFGVTSMM